MKKLIAGCFFAIALLFSTQNITAQNTSEIDVVAKKKTKELRKLINFDTAKMDAVYNAYQEFGKAHKKCISNSEQNDEQLQKLNTILDEKLESIFTKLEYHNYLELVRGR